MRFRRLNISGETIIEVMIVASVISGALGVAFASTNTTLNNSRVAQERAEGSAVAQTQIERLKTLVAANEDVPTDKFCISSNNAIIKISNTDTTVGTASAQDDDFAAYQAKYPGCVNNRYYTHIKYNATERLYTTYIRWENAAGGGQRENVEMSYRTFYQTPAAVPPSDPTPPPVPTNSEVCLAQSPQNEFQGCYYNSVSPGPCSNQSTNFALAQNDGGPTGLNITLPGGDSAAGSPGPGVDPEEYSACWRGRFVFPAGSTTFHITADDGMRLYVDGTLIFDRFVQQSPTSYQVATDLTAGEHEVKIEYYENAGDSVAKVSWVENEQLPRTGLVWVDLTESNFSNSPANAKMATGKNFCWQVFEYYDIYKGNPYDGWDNNYLCSDTDLGITWKQDGTAGSAAGKFCSQWLASADPDTWNDNYLCSNQPLGLRFSDSGNIPGLSCISIKEPLDSEPAIWNPPSGTARLCETAAAPAPFVIENETFTGAGSSAADSAASAGATRAHYSTGDSQKTVATPAIRGMIVRAKGDVYPANGFPNMTVKVDGVTVFNGGVASNSYGEYRIGGINYPAGSHTFTVSFDNDAYCGTSATDRNLYVDKIDVYQDVLSSSPAPALGPTAAPACPPPPGPTASDCAPSAPARSGTFVGCYYTDRNATNLGLVRSDNPINFDWGSGSPDPSIPADNFSVRWNGDFGFAADTYNFTVTGDDGIRLIIDGNTVLDKYYDQSPTTYVVPVTLTSGTHNIKLQYYENGGGAVARLSWTPKPASSNVALGKPVSNAYCTPGNYYYVVPDSRLTDGSNGTNTAQCNYTFDYIVDLGAAHNLTSIRPYWGVFGCVPGQPCSNGANYINNWQILYSNDRSNWASLASGGYPYAAQTVVNTNINARYIRVYATSSYNWIAMYELEAMGVPL